MWNFKHLIIGILFAICALVCGVAWIFFDGGNFQTGFLVGESNGNFAPMGTIIFGFFSIIFFRNARR